MTDFNLEAFIEGVAKDRSAERNPEDRLKKVLMNTKDNQGTIQMIPIISKKVGNIYQKLERVREYQGATTLLDAGTAWYRVLPVEYYGELTPKQLELYNEVIGLYDQVFDYGLDFNEARVRRYSLFTGIALDHISLDGEISEDLKDKPCLFVYPSLSPIDALNTAITTKRGVLKDRTISWLSNIITPATTGRKGIMMITFKKPDSPGYTSTVEFSMNNSDEGLFVIDPKFELTEEVLSKFDDPLKTFLGWMYDYDNSSYFNETIFIELRDILKIRLKELSTESSPNPAPQAPNMNSSVDPMTSQTTTTQSNPNRPF